jgi:hypothetical protein
VGKEHSFGPTFGKLFISSSMALNKSNIDNFTALHPEPSLDSSWSMLPSPFFLNPAPEKYDTAGCTSHLKTQLQNVLNPSTTFLELKVDLLVFLFAVSQICGSRAILQILSPSHLQFLFSFEIPSPSTRSKAITVGASKYLMMSDSSCIRGVGIGQ